MTVKEDGIFAGTGTIPITGSYCPASSKELIRDANERQFTPTKEMIGMTIPEYDQECDCDFCTTLRNDRLRVSKEKHVQRNPVPTPEAGDPK